MEFKQVIVVRKDLKLPKGKLAVQVAHASVEAAMRSDDSKVESWRDEGQMKAVLKVDGEDELIEVLQRAKDQGLKTALITDAGKTVIAPGTKTCVGIGPDEKEKIDKVTGGLSLV